MKKLIMLAVLTVIAVGFLAACSSVPKHANMTGSWKYTFEENGKDGVYKGTMTIAQESYRLSGKCNDAFGEFDLSGTISENGPKIMLDGKRNDLKRNFHFTGMLSSDNEFEGTYTTDQNTSGTMKGERVSAH